MSSAETVDEAVPPPVTIAGERVGLNGAIAAALTRWVGSMPALYVTLVFCGGWMALATWGPLHGADPYPFAFLLFMNNVVQLVLCSVILVGQRVLGMAADRRAVQTYESAEAIFARVADLQAHLDRQDQALGRGVSLLESSTHPWIQRHRVQPPPQAMDQVVGINGRIAAWLTVRLGSMAAFYVSAGSQVVWIGMAQLGFQHFDPYPFAFMTFLSTFVQLIFMIVIMVGQDVLERASDRRSEQTFLDAEAILHECRRMEARLTAQDRVIDRLVDYTSAQVTEHLAQALHQGRTQTPGQGDLGDERMEGTAAAHGPWNELPEEARETIRHQARQVGERLAAIGFLMIPASDADQDAELTVAFDDQEAQMLARLEHQYRLAASEHRDAQSGLVPWEQLSEQEREQAVETVRYIPAVLADVGFEVLRTATLADGPGELDFPAEEWAVLQRALMAAGVLVSLAEGVVDADEIVALIQLLREASFSHPRRFVRELAALPSFDLGLPAGATYTDYQGPALQVIGRATGIVAARAPAELETFRAFLTQISTTVADANEEGGFFGLGARQRVPKEVAAIHAIADATRLDRPDQQSS